MRIEQNMTECNYTPKNELSRIRFIVIHFTANNGDTAYSNTRYFKAENRGASAHYFVDEKSVWQCVADGDIAWHCGTKGAYYSDCRNANSLGVELCSRKSAAGYYFAPETVERAISLVRELMTKYHVPIERVIRHYDVTHKLCPEPFVRNEQAWNDFKKRLCEKEEMSVTQYEELKQLIAENRLTVYRYTQEVPEWGRATIQKLLDKGYYTGESESNLALSSDMLRIFTVMDRAGLFDK